MKITGSTFVVFGLARTGMAAVSWLIARGARVIALDNDTIKQQQAHSYGAQIITVDNINWTKITALVQSPGISCNHSVTLTAKQYNVPVIGDCDLFRLGNPRAIIIGITGTNGKSTTTTLVGHIIRSAGVPVAIGGNVGVPVLSLAQLPENGVYVFELSSFQLELSHNLNLDIVGWLNISEDHLDRHDDMAGYVAAKERLFCHDIQPRSVVCIDEPWSAGVYYRQQQLGLGQTTSVTITGSQPADLWVDDGILYDSTTSLFDLRKVERLQGIHNFQNIAVAWALCRYAEISDDKIAAGIMSFPGLAHRQEFVRQIGNVTFVNDSKATNADAAAKALATFDDIYWIVGGQEKSDGIGLLESYFPKIKHAFLIGQAQESFSKAMSNTVDYSCCGSLEVAVGKAYQFAQHNGSGVVLLSPACSSYDQFRDFEHRGDRFRELVLNLPSGNNS